MKTAIKSFFSLGLLMAVFFLPKIALAKQKIDEQPIYDTGASSFGTASGFKDFLRVGAHGQLGEIDLFIQNVSLTGTGNDRLYVELYDYTSSSTVASTNSSGSYIYPSDLSNTEPRLIKFYFNTPYTLNAAHLYSFFVRPVAFTSDTFQVYGTTQNYSQTCVKNGLSGVYPPNGSATYCDNSVVKLGYTAWDATTFYFVNPPQSFSYPGSTILDFDQWRLNVENLAANTKYWLEVSTAYGDDYEQIYSFDTTSGIYAVPKSYPLNSSSTIPTWATAKLWNNQTVANVDSTSTLIQTQTTYFSISGSVGGQFLNSQNSIYPAAGTPYSTSSPATTGSQTCAPTDFTLNFGFGSVDFGQGVCNILYFLFAPPQFITSWFSNIQNSMAFKLPFSYVGDIKLAWDNVSSTTSVSLPSIKATIPSTTMSNLAGTNVVIFASSSVQSVISGSSAAGTWFTDIRPIEVYALDLAWLMAILFSVYLIFK